MSPVKPSLISGIIVVIVSVFIIHEVYAEHRQKVLLIRQEIARVADLEQERGRVVGDLSELEGYGQHLSPSSDTVWLVQQVGRLASESGVMLASIDPKEARKLGDFYQPSVSVRFEATYHELGKFLGALESSQRYIHVDGVGLSAMPGEVGSARASLHMEISTLFLPPAY